jgi:hypothetical protein
MSSKPSSSNFLPKVFQTSANRQFLGSTLDVITASPNLRRVEGFAGYQYGYAVERDNKFVSEINAERNNYQLSPSLVFTDEVTGEAVDFIDYPGILQSLRNKGVATNDVNRLFSSETYSWDSFTDLDKIINYSNYFWLPLGPDAIPITGVSDISEVNGKKQYISTNDVVFVNGIKVSFTDSTNPKKQYYVEGVGKSITLVPVDDMLSVENRGTTGLLEPWDNAEWDSAGWDVRLFVPVDPDYVTINRISKERNSWSRGNRWFSKVAIDTTEKHLGYVTRFSNNMPSRARRPIIEFRGNLQLFNYGSSWGGFVDFIDNSQSSPLVNVPDNSPVTITWNGVTATPIPGSTVLFANSTNDTIRKTIYHVDEQLIGTNSYYILRPIKSCSENDIIAVKSGPGNSKGDVFKFHESEWVHCQQKTNVNQSPLFDIFNENGVSFSDQNFYPGSDFSGTKLFSYKSAVGKNDAVLGFPISFSSVFNIGDINFTVDYNNDIFSYTGNSIHVNTGYVHTNLENGYSINNGWVKSTPGSIQYKVFKFDIHESTLILSCDAVPRTDADITPIQIYVNGEFIGSDFYTYTVADGVTTIALNEVIPENSVASVLIYGSVPLTSSSFDTFPSNLQKNPFNDSIQSVTVGDIRSHYKTIFHNAPGMSGTEFGINNYDNLGDLTSYGSSIIQHKNSLVLPALSSRHPDFDIEKAAKFNGVKYTDFKNLLIRVVEESDFSVYSTPREMLSTVMRQIIQSRGGSKAFIYNDMVPAGDGVVSRYTFDANVQSARFTLSTTRDWTSAGFWSVLVYHTRNIDGRRIETQLTRGLEWDKISETSSILVKYNLEIGDTIEVVEYEDSWGAPIPATPTKLGILPAYRPEIILDETYLEPTWVMVGHDGSRTVLFGDVEYNIPGDASSGIKLIDFRDAVLFEYEQIVFNNLKLDGHVTAHETEIMPGAWRDVGWTVDEIRDVYKRLFLGWVGDNRLDYTTQYWDGTSNKFLFNYSESLDRINNSPIPCGGWRGMYRWYYDTDYPHVEPWKMIGYTIKPQWWENRYGAAPYTSGNALLWDDMESGTDWNNGDPITRDRYVRPGLSKVIPVDASGNLLPPLNTIVGYYNSSSFKKDWSVGDSGPVENAYRNSSQWRYNLATMLALFSPARFFNQFIDTDSVYYNKELDQTIRRDGSRDKISSIELINELNSVHSYMNWFVDYLEWNGRDGSDTIRTVLNNLDVRLTYRLSGFSDKSYLNFYIERSTPLSSTPRLLIPDDSYDLLLYRSQPHTNIQYSNVIIQKSDSGWVVTGNNVEYPFFSVVMSDAGMSETITADGVSVTIRKQFNPENIEYIPYGSKFNTVTEVAQFLVDYGNQLELNGINDESVDYYTPGEWRDTIRDFISWSNLEWDVGSTVALNPYSRILSVEPSRGVVEPTNSGTSILDQNLLPFTPDNSAIVRDGNKFAIQSLYADKTIAYADLRISDIEHAIVFDNTTIFNDVIYQLNTGLRQDRVILSGQVTDEWDGSANAWGFIMNDTPIPQWSETVRYPAGSRVSYRGEFWQSLDIIEPSDEFDESMWRRTYPDRVKRGLIPNAATAALEATKLYDVNSANLERDKDLLAFGLIGFRPRGYFADAELSDVTQVNLYRDMIANKGTSRSAGVFKKAKLVQGDIDYDIVEYWALKQGDFGAVGNSQMITAVVSGDKVSDNYSIFKFGPKDIQLSEIISWGRAPRSSDFLPAYSGRGPRSLPTAGPVSMNDVDISVFAITDLNIDPVLIDKVRHGTSIWCASHRGSWDVLRAERIVTGLISSIAVNDGVLLQTAKPHGLAIGDYVFFNDMTGFNPGVYRITSIPGMKQIVVDSIEDIGNTSAGDANIFVLRSLRNKNNIFPVPDVMRGEWRNDLYSWSGDEESWVTHSNSREFANPVSVGGGGAIGFSAELGPVYATEDGHLVVNRTTRLDLKIGTIMAVARNRVIASDGTVVTVWIQNPPDMNGVITESTSVIPIADVKSIAVSTDGRFLFMSVSGVAVHIYGWDGDEYVIETSPLNPSAVSPSWGSSIACSTDGDVLVIGAPDETVNGVQKVGRAYRYARIPTGVWVLQNVLEPKNGSDGALFGYSVAVRNYGDEIFAGAPFQFDSIGRNEGGVYRYVSNDLNVGKIIANSGLGGGIFNLAGATHRLYVNDAIISIVTGESWVSIAERINIAEKTDVIASVETVSNPDGTFTESLLIEAVGVGVRGRRLRVRASSQAVLDEFNFNLIEESQYITEPYGLDSRFGSSIAVNNDNTDRRALLIGAPRSNILQSAVFDEGNTFFDRDTTWFAETLSTGGVFQYDLMGDKYILGDVFGWNSGVVGENVGFGSYVENGLKCVAMYSAGELSIETRSNKKLSSWDTHRLPQPIADAHRVNNVSISDIQTNNTIGRFNIFDPVVGVHLSIVDENIDYISEVDPAVYSSGLTWGVGHAGKMWLDTSNYRVHQCSGESLSEMAQKWGVATPGSRADVYTWVISDVQPVDWNGSGSPSRFDRFVTFVDVDHSTQSLVTRYGYWVRNSTDIPSGKSASASTLENYLINPVNSGIPYVCPLTTSSIALVNAGEFDGNDVHLNIGWSINVDGGRIHSDWKLYGASQPSEDFFEGVPNGFGSEPHELYEHFLSSLSGYKLNGIAVPDNSIPELLRSGLGSVPQQTMFVDRLMALRTLREFANRYLMKTPVLQIRNNLLLTSTDNAGYWKTVDWWSTGIDPVKSTVTVNRYTDLLTIGKQQRFIGVDEPYIELIPGLTVKVTNTGISEPEIWQWNSTEWVKLSVLGGTIQITEKWIDSPADSIRSMVRWLVEEVFIDEQKFMRNMLLNSMLDVVISSAQLNGNFAPWLTKTSLIDITHLVRELKPAKKYQRDNQNTVRDYLREVLPYHVHMKEFGLKFITNDVVEIGEATDFDIPSAWDESSGGFTSPRLVWSGSGSGAYTPDADVWNNPEYRNWFRNAGISLGVSGEDSLVGFVASETVQSTISAANGLFSGTVTVLDRTTVPSSGSIVVDGIRYRYTSVNRYTGALTLASGTVTLRPHSVGTSVSIVGDSLNTGPRIPMLSVEGLPVRGTVRIGNELIEYSGLDYNRPALLNAVRGAGGTVGARHPINSEVRFVANPVNVIRSGRGFNNIDIDWSDEISAPAERSSIQYRANLIGGSLQSVDLLNNGDGYWSGLKPTVSVSSITGSWSTVNADNSITIIGHNFVSGDPVMETITGDRWWVGVIDANTITLHRSKHDALSAWSSNRTFLPNRDITRIAPPTSGTIAIMAHLAIRTSTTPIRAMTTTLKFDRTSYRYNSGDRNAIWRIQNYYKPRFNMPGFDLNDYDQLMTGTKYPGVTVLDPEFNYGKVFSFDNSNVDTTSNTITISLQIGEPPVASNGGMMVGGVYRAVYSGAAVTVGWPIDNAQTVFLRAVNIGLNNVTVSVHPTRNSAIINSDAISLVQTTGHFIITDDNIAVNDIDSFVGGTTFTDSVDEMLSGGGFTDGWAPEELVPSTIHGAGSIVTIMTPGGTWDATSFNYLGGGTGFNRRTITALSAAPIIDWSGIVPHPATIDVWSSVDNSGAVLTGGGYRRVNPAEYTVDWTTGTITLGGSLVGSDIVVSVNSWGNGRQLIRSDSTHYPPRDIGGATHFVLDVNYSDILMPDVTNGNTSIGFSLNGVVLEYGTDYTVEPLRPLDAVNDPYNPAVIVLNGLFDDTIDYASFAITGIDATASNGAITVSGDGLSLPYTSWHSGIAGTGVTLPIPTNHWLGDDNIDNIIVEVNGMRIAGAAPKTVQYTAINSILAYGAPVYGLRDFDITKMVVKVNGIDVATDPTTWLVDYDPLANGSARFDAEYGLLYGLFDSGVPFDNWTALDVVFNPGFLTPGDIIEIEYDRDGAPNPVFVVTPNANNFGGDVTLNYNLVAGDSVSITSFGRTTQQHLDTVVASDITVSVLSGITGNSLTPVTVTTTLDHNLEPGDRVRIAGSGATTLNGSTWWVDVISPTSVVLYRDAGLTLPLYMNSVGVFDATNIATISVFDIAQVPPTVSRNPLDLGQSGFNLLDKDRIMVSILENDVLDTSKRVYLAPHQYEIFNNTLHPLVSVRPGFTVAVTTMVPVAQPEGVRIRNTFNTRRGLSDRTVLSVVNRLLPDTNSVGSAVVLNAVSTSTLNEIYVSQNGSRLDVRIFEGRNGPVPFVLIALPNGTVGDVVVDYHTKIPPTVYRENNSTWVISSTTSFPTDYLTDSITVRHADRIVDTLDIVAVGVVSIGDPGQPSLGISYCDITVDDSIAVTAIEGITGWTRENTSPFNIRLTGVPTGSFNLTLRVGNSIRINGEQILFRSITVNPDGTGTVNGIYRGQNGTTRDLAIEPAQWDRVDAVIDSHQLKSSYSYLRQIDWSGSSAIDTDVPLQISGSSSSIFLSQH